MSLSEYREKVSRLIQDEAGRLSNEDIEAFIAEALSYYSKDAPFYKVADIAGDGGYQYDLPQNWLEGFSGLISVEYPAGRQLPVILESGDYTVYKTPQGLKLHFYSFSPQIGESIRLNYTTAYTQADIDSIPLADQDIFCVLAAALCCEALARYYAQTSDTLVEADSVNYRTKSDEYARRTKELISRYHDFMGKKEDSPRAAGQTLDWDVSYSWGGDYLIHPRKYR
ncbi:MAG: hypothetical protein HZA78_10595 [Candidatus Schekmanbacteria bacterium]|nr:hypothetical protein [Candidatus Schekmanbacteria bacterium]